jgi:hypothetical protein
MDQINWKRVILGGLLAGVVINIFEAVNGMLYMEEMTAALEAHSLTMSESAGAILLYLGLGFLFGIVGVWIYAAIRPRFGPGPKTAFRAVIVVWLFYLGSILGWSSIGLYSTWMLGLWTVVGFVETTVGLMLGAWLYKEEAVASPSS